MEISKIEKTILNYHKKYTPIILIIILTLYIFNVNNHYRLFLIENEKLRNEIKAQSIDFNSANRFIKKLLNKQDLIGNKFPFLNEHLIGNYFKVVYTMGVNASYSSKRKTLKIIKKIEMIKKDIKIMNFSDFNNFGKTTKRKIIENYFYHNSMIFLLGKNNYILSIFSFDGNESNEEIELIIQYLLNKIPK